MTTATERTAADVHHFVTDSGHRTLEELKAEPNPPWVSRVVWTDGSWSWAQSLHVWVEAEGVWRLGQVGAGAAGNLVLWTDWRGLA